VHLKRKEKGMAKKQTSLTVETLTHEESTRKNIPTAEYQSVMDETIKSPIRLAYERRNRDLDPQLVWRGKDEQDWSDLVVYAPPLYIQEKVHPKVLIDDLLKETQSGKPKQMDSSLTSTASPRTRTRPSSTPTTRIGPTA
jgi:adenine-specific DNA-methyltransferase